MAYTTLISTAELAQHLTDPDWAIFDCRFSLADLERGRRDYQQEHIPGALYVHLNEDLAGPVIPDVTGRHPLPTINLATERFSEWGIDQRVQVVVYDDVGGAYAARLWWMLRWLGHDAVAVLDGGWPKWKGEAREKRDGLAFRASRRFVPRPRPELLSTTEEIEALLRGARPSTSLRSAQDALLTVTADFKLFDSRTAERYRGANETIDPIAGHIPGAISAPYSDNLNPDGTFRSDEELHTRFTALLSDTPADHATFYCGSGVTAAQNILAVKHVGLGDARLYAGSWSEWITDPEHPIEK